VAVSEAALRTFRVKRLATSRSERQPATCYSYLVDGTLVAPFAIETAGRLAMIADGRAPGTVVNVDRDPCGSGQWEVVISHRPLRTGESFNHTGRRISVGGTKADPS
jgi:hypothetical protein